MGRYERVWTDASTGPDLTDFEFRGPEDVVRWAASEPLVGHQTWPDVFHLDGGRALVADFKSNWLGEHDPAEVVEAEYRLQRLVYALACFRAGAEEAEVVYQFLERPDDLIAATFTRDQVPELEAELSAAIERIQAGQFPPRPSEFACAGCPALDLVCAGPNLP